MTDKNNQQTFFDKLCAVVHPTSLKVANNYLDSKIDKYQPGRRYKADKYKIHDERMVAINEVIFELDWKAYKLNYQNALKILEVLENYGIDSLICASGGKGIHIHIFFERLEFTIDKHKTLFKEALSYGFGYKSIRIWFLKKICSEAGIDDKFIGKQVDTSPITFNYFAGTTHLIRDIGGRKYNRNVEGDWEAHYKTWIPRDEFTHKKPKVTSFDDVQFPEAVPTFKIDTVDLCEYLVNYIKFQQDLNINKSKNIKFDNTYLDLEGVMRIREGMPEGKRSSGASVLAIACRIDDMSQKDAKEVMKEYVLNCSQLGTTFVQAEAENWLQWIYMHDKPFWNCSLLEELDVHDRATCQYCQSANKDAMKILQKSNLLDMVKEVLDELIVGEDELKMLIFLLCMSKDFPSKTGRPGWNVLSDSMSQNAIISADSSSGKTWIIKAILELFGEDKKDYWIMSRITKSALNYFTENNMDGKIIFIEEMQGLDEDTSQLRIWMSEGSLSLTTVEKFKDEDGVENNKQSTKTTIGQPVFLTCQAEGKVETQLNNRSWVLSTDISWKQTEGILGFQDDVYRGLHTNSEIKKRKIVDALKQLKPHHFKVPFASYKAMGIPTEDVRSRRDYKKFITLIQCSAYLHQKMRQVETDEEGREYLICDIQDYEVARRYSHNILGATFSGLTNGQIDVLNLIRQFGWKEEFNITTLMRNFGKSQSHWYGMMGQLVDLGFVFELDRGGRGSATTYALNMDKALNIISLPSGEELLRKVAAEGDGKHFKKSSIPDEEQITSSDGSSQQKLVSQNGGSASKVEVSKSTLHSETVDHGTNSKELESVSEVVPAEIVEQPTTESAPELLIKIVNANSEKKNPAEKNFSSVELSKSHNNSAPTGSSTQVQLKGTIPDVNNKEKMLQHLRSQKGGMGDSLSIIRHLKIDTDVAYELISKSISEGDIFETRPDMYVVLE